MDGVRVLVQSDTVVVSYCPQSQLRSECWILGMGATDQGLFERTVAQLVCYSIAGEYRAALLNLNATPTLS